MSLCTHLDRSPSGSWPAPASTGQQYRYSKRRYRLLFGLLDGVCAPLVGLGRSLRSMPRPAKPRSILVVQLDHIGDAVMSTPLLRALRGRFPEAAIDVLGARWNEEIFRASPYVRRVHISQRNWQGRVPAEQSGLPEALRLGRQMRRCRYDLGIDPRGDFLIALVLRLAGIPRRLGWSAGGGGFLLSDAPAWHETRHETKSRLALLEPLDAQCHDTQPEVTPGWADRYAVREMLDTLPDCPGPLVVVHVAAGTSAKRWPEAYLAELLDQLGLLFGPQIVLVGEVQDRWWARVLAEDRPRVADWTGRLSLTQLAALLAESDLFIGADSGPAHIAAAVGTPCVVLFSGTNDSQRWRPIGRQVTVLRRPVPCSPCHLKQCPVPGHPCMSGIRPSDVLAAASELLTREQTEAVEMDSSRSLS